MPGTECPPSPITGPLPPNPRLVGGPPPLLPAPLFQDEQRQVSVGTFANKLLLAACCLPPSSAPTPPGPPAGQLGRGPPGGPAPYRLRAIPVNRPVNGLRILVTQEPHTLLYQPANQNHKSTQQNQTRETLGEGGGGCCKGVGKIIWSQDVVEKACKGTVSRERWAS